MNPWPPPTLTIGHSSANDAVGWTNCAIDFNSGVVLIDRSTEFFGREACPAIVRPKMRLPVGLSTPNLGPLFRAAMVAVVVERAACTAVGDNIN